jgi:hyperosmotically inducible protein
VRALSLALIVLVAALGGCATFDPLEDTRIEAEVKARLVAQKDANLTRLGVLSTNGTVYLSGVVEQPDQKPRAEAIARGVPGVKRVVNTVEVK